MFTGIIEAMGVVTQVTEQQGNRLFRVQSPISHELKVDQSLSHDGVCLTVTALGDGWHEVVAIAETLSKTHLGSWKLAYQVNLERALQAGARLDGHMVQGHCDTVGHLTAITDQNGSWKLDFTFPAGPHHLVVEKGSICVNGISLTCFNVSEIGFSVAIIPYTWQYTNLSQIAVGAAVNLEFDILGKYLATLYQRQLAS